MMVFNSSREERVVRVGDNAIIYKREMFCTAESSEEWARMQASGRLGCRFQPVQVVYYYERRPEHTGVLRCQPVQKLEFHNGWWEDGELIVEDRRCVHKVGQGFGTEAEWRTAVTGVQRSGEPRDA
eukprot:jgi/Botrbrau1/10281/Bobra.0120s0003.1